MNRILIAGTGRMGSWFARLPGRNCKVAVYDKMVRVDFRESGNITLISEPCEISSFGPDLLINCVGIDSTIEAFDELSGYLPDSCIISDIASLKENLHEYYIRSGNRFASVHPMFGPTFASPDNLRGLNAFIIEESDSEGKEFFERLFSEAGINIYETTFKEHDRIMSEALALPMLTTLLFTSCTSGDIPAGTTYSRHVSIVEGLLREDPELITRILLNRFNDEKISGLSDTLCRLKRLLENGDSDGMKAFIKECRERFRLTPGG